MGTETTGFMRGADLGKMLKDAETPVELTGFGELVCPHCNTNVGNITEAGTSRCPSCHRSFDVPKDIIEKINRFNANQNCPLKAIVP